MAEHLVGVIGGSGLYQMKDLKILEKIPVETPFGSPSAELVRGELQGTQMMIPFDILSSILEAKISKGINICVPCSVFWNIQGRSLDPPEYTTGDANNDPL